MHASLHPFRHRHPRRRAGDGGDRIASPLGAVRRALLAVAGILPG